MTSASLEGRVVLVTGATGTIGTATASCLARAGARIFAVARREAVLKALIADLPGRGHRWRALDVADLEAWDQAAASFDAVTDVVYAAAVLGPIGEVGTYKPSEFAETISVNLLGALSSVHYCLPGLRAASGTVVLFSGGGATAPLPRFDAYAASKAALVRLVENLSTVLAPEIRVNAVAPGFVASAMHDETLRAGADRAGLEYHARTVRDLASGGFPAGEAAELVSLLLSPSGAGVTGKLISAQWDEWRDPAFLDRLRTRPDLGTLRRIDDVLFVQGQR